MLDKANSNNKSPSQAAREAGALAKGSRGDFVGKTKGGRGKGVSGGVKKPRRKEPTLAEANNKSKRLLKSGEVARRAAARRYRTRVKACRVCVSVEIDSAVLDWLIDRAHWLPATAAEDRKAIGNAITAGLALSAKAAKDGA
jgi:hypothetical protein